MKMWGVGIVLLLCVACGNAMESDNEQVIDTLSKQEMWGMYSKGKNILDLSIKNPFTIGCYQDFVTKLEQFRDGIRHELVKETHLYTHKWKNDYHVSDGLWAIVQEYAQKMDDYEQKRRHKRTLKDNTVRVSPEVKKLFDHQFEKYKIHPGRMSLLVGKDLWSDNPVLSVAYSQDYLTCTIDPALIEPGTIVIQDTQPLIHKPMVLFLVERLFHHDRRLGVLTSIDKNIKITDETWGEYGNLINKKTFFLCALKSFKKAQKMLQLCFSLNRGKFCKDQYEMLVKIEQYWRLYTWLQERLKGIPVPVMVQNHALEYYHIDQQMAEIADSVKNYSKEEILKQLRECETIIRNRKSEALKALRKKLCIPDTIWNEVAQGLRVIRVYEKENAQVPLAEVVHDLPSDLLEPLKTYLEKNGINPGRVSLCLSKEEKAGKFCPLDTSFTYQSAPDNPDKLVIKIKGKTAPGFIAVPRIVCTEKEMAPVFLWAAARYFACNTLYIPLFLQIIEPFFNATPYPMTMLEEWKNLERCYDYTEELFLTMAFACHPQAGAYVRDLMRKSNISTENYALGARITMLQDAYSNLA